MSTTKKPIPRNTIIGKSSLLITARGQKELASQVFNYDLIREIRLDLENKEIKLLMTYDESYYRVFQTVPETDSEKDTQEAQQKLLRFYNDLLHATMKLTAEEVENLNKQVEAQKALAAKAAKEKENQENQENPEKIKN